MTPLLQYRDTLENIYRKYDYWLIPLCKAIVSLIIFFMVGSHLGSAGLVRNPLVLLAAALLCSFLPWTGITVCAAMFMLGGLYKISLEFTAVTLVIFLIAALLQTTFQAKHAILIVLVPLAFILHIPYVIPVAAGLSLGFISIIPTTIGVMMYYYLTYAAANASTLTKAGDMTEMAAQYADIFVSFFNNHAMIVAALAFILAILVVYVISSLQINYAWEIAASAGLITVFAVELARFQYIKAAFHPVNALGSLLISALILALYVLTFHGADYQRTERVKFEDDDYFYYVKAVPKLKASKHDTVTKS